MTHRQQLEEALLKARNAAGAAKILGVCQQTVYSWIARYGLAEENGSVRIRKIRFRLKLNRSTRN